MKITLVIKCWRRPASQSFHFDFITTGGTDGAVAPSSGCECSQLTVRRRMLKVKNIKWHKFSCRLGRFFPPDKLGRKIKWSHVWKKFSLRTHVVYNSFVFHLKKHIFMDLTSSPPSSQHVKSLQITLLITDSVTVLFLILIVSSSNSNSCIWQ